MTFCVWNLYSENQWCCISIDFLTQDGSEELLSILDGKAKTYQQWAEQYYAKHIDINCINHIYQHKILTNNIIKKLNSDIVIQYLTHDIEEIGY